MRAVSIALLGLLLAAPIDPPKKPAGEKCAVSDEDVAKKKIEVLTRLSDKLLNISQSHRASPELKGISKLMREHVNFDLSEAKNDARRITSGCER